MTEVDFLPGLRECLATLLTLIRHVFLRDVEILCVLYQWALRAKALTALYTLERLLLRVDPLVNLQKGGASKLFLAVRARECAGRHLFCPTMNNEICTLPERELDYLMAAPMACQCLLCGTFFATMLADTKLFPMVSHVSCKGWLNGGLEVTLLTSVLFGAFHVHLQSMLS